MYSYLEKTPSNSWILLTISLWVSFVSIFFSSWGYPSCNLILKLGKAAFHKNKWGVTPFANAIYTNKHPVVLRILEIFADSDPGTLQPLEDFLCIRSSRAANLLHVAAGGMNLKFAELLKKDHYELFEKFKKEENVGRWRPADIAKKRLTEHACFRKDEELRDLQRLAEILEPWLKVVPFCLQKFYYFKEMK